MSVLKKKRKAEPTYYAVKRSKPGELWHRFKQNKMAFVSLIVLGIIVIACILAPIIAPYDPAKQNLTERFTYPCLAHLFGTDDFGRDILTRILYGGRISLLVALMSVLIAFVVAMFLGSLCGFYGGIVDSTIMRVVDIFMAIPGLLLTLSISAALGPGLLNTAIAMGVSSISPLTRVLRSSILLLKDQEYMTAARSFGASDKKIILTHLIPNAMAPVIVQFSMSIGGAITGIAGLSFLGLGVQPPTPEWGNMLSSGQQYIRQFWPLITFPGIVIAIVMLCFNLLGDGLRDALDPRLKK
jgi:peptide/nickel transport system permease protein